MYLSDGLDSVLNDDLGDQAGGLVQDETEMVLREHTVRGVGCPRVVEHLRVESQRLIFQ